MRRVTGWLALCTVALVPGGSAIHSAAPPAASFPVPVADAPYARTAGETDVTDHAYGSRRDQRVTVYENRGGTGPRPAVLLLHGGYWSYRGTWSSLPYDLADDGFVVLDAGYALSPHGRWPAQIDDARRALDWTIENADRLGVDPDRIVALGSSAGGHVATVLGAHPGARGKLRGVVALSPVVSPYRAWVNGGRKGASPRQRRLRDAAEELVGCRPVRSDPACRERWRSASVGRYASKEAAPMLLLHSSDDYVPAANTRAVTGRMPSATVRVVPGGGHGRGLLSPEVTAEMVRWAKDRVR
ncbi:alpha/beta hydrolase [Streptomyces sp. XM4193]|uniref:alpha/beta hydrolase n=1 Tax=Streptomyces sp. XM4193 TaxID=2929782 RepID=UPI001FF770C5|nr:alpha/beta hydrolase [Streptomyces sp. XM4193]MCK1796948.1 alpha/beta hydrolase [Streptomyces sp. XM4193]